MKKFLVHFYVLIFLLVFFAPSAVSAQSLSLSVTPPLFQLSVERGDIWQSSIKVLNTNRDDLVVYAEVVNFLPEGEHGHGRFIPILDSRENTGTLAEWIDVSPGPHVIQPEQTKNINFFVDVPDDAPPGGHFAAILITTRPIDDSGEKMLLKTSQAVTSLFFVRIEGDVIEEGTIREFSMEKTFIPTPEADFILRFENKGNVHLQPRGNIVITNMWGNERGVIPINHLSHFGNVLPNSIREFNFSWKSEPSVSEIGRYKAVVTLGYGQNGIKNTSSETYFWVLPVKGTIITLGSIALFILFIAWVIRLYIRRMLALAGVDVNSLQKEEVQKDAARDVEQISEPDTEVKSFATIKMSAPVRSGVSDFKNRMSGVSQSVDVVKTFFEFIWSYKLFFSSVIIITIGFIAGVLFISDASKDGKNYEVVIDRDGESTTVNSEEIIKDRISEFPSQNINEEQHFELVLINDSNIPGLAAETSVYLETEGYRVDSLRVGDGEHRDRSLITYTAGLDAEVSALESMLNITSESEYFESNASSTAGVIRVYIGNDLLEQE